MKKLMTNCVLACGLLSAANFDVSAQTYCENGAQSADFFWIESVASGDFYHSAGPLQGVLDDQDHLYPGYVDYTDLMINWEVGINPLELTPGVLLPNYPLYWQVWVDLNQDQVFSQDELLLSEQNLSAVIGAVDLTGLAISNDVVTRMRVSMNFMDPAPVCGGFAMGEVEDYSVTIQAPSQFTWRVPEDHASIQAAVDAALPGDQVLVNEGVYYETVVIDKALSLKSVNGYEATTLIGDANQHTITVQSADVSIQGFDVAGGSGNLKAGIYFGAGADNGLAKDNRCASVAGVDASYAGVYVDEADGVEVTGNWCETQGRFGIRVDDSMDSRVLGNVANNQTSTGIYVYRSDGVVIEQNSVSGNEMAGININKLTHGWVIGNQCSDNIDTEAHFRGGKGISVIYSDGLNITGNHCIGNDGIGISARLSDDVVVAGNTANENEIGIHAGAAHRMHIINNISNGNLNQGVLVASSDGVVMDGNEVLLNAADGLQLTRSNQAVVADNQLLSNGMGFSVRESNQSTFSGNTIQASEAVGSACQFLMYRSTGNRFFLNDFYLLFDPDWCVDQDSSNQWHTNGPVDYIHDFTSFNGYLGNFYSGLNHQDADGDGVADQVVVLPGNQQTDEFALIQAKEAYQVQ